MAYVYRHIREDLNMPFYVGIGGLKTPDNFKRARSSTKRSRHWKNIKSSTTYRVEILFDDLTEIEAKEKEIEFVKLYGRADLGLGTLVNFTDGGEGITGLKRSKEFIEKLRVANIGRKHSAEAIIKMKLSAKNRVRKPCSEETKLKISNSTKGRVISQESIQKRVQKTKGRVPWNKGKKMSVEQRLKLSIKAKGRPLSQAQIDGIKKSSSARIGIPNTGASKTVLNLETGIYYESINEACKSIGKHRGVLNSKIYQKVFLKLNKAV